MSPEARKPVFSVFSQTRPNKIWPVQSHKKARSLKRNCTIPVVETKAHTDQLCGYCTADLRFLHRQNPHHIQLIFFLDN